MHCLEQKVNSAKKLNTVARTHPVLVRAVLQKMYVTSPSATAECLNRRKLITALPSLKARLTFEAVNVPFAFQTIGYFFPIHQSLLTRSNRIVWAYATSFRVYVSPSCTMRVSNKVDSYAQSGGRHSIEVVFALHA